MTSHFILFAAGWPDVVVPIVVFVIWIVNQMIGLRKAGQQQGGRMPQRPQQPAGQQGAGQQAGQNAGNQRGLMDEVEQFLRDARKAMEQQQQPGRNPPPPQQRPQQQRPQQRQKQKPPKLPKQAQQPKGRVPLAEQQSLRTKLEQRDRDDVERGDSVSEHVRQHLDTSRFAERAGRLSQLKQQVDQDIGGHVHGALDHQVGRLAETPAAAAPDATPNVAAQIAAMIGDPASLRNAIILQEILTPPTHRW